MVGTRSRTPTASGKDGSSGTAEASASHADTATGEEEQRSPSIETAAQMPSNRSASASVGGTSLERLPRRTRRGGSDDGPNSTSIGRSGTVTGTGGPRVTTQTSLERLPLPPPPASTSSVLERSTKGRRAGAGIGAEAGVARGMSTRAGAAAPASRTNSELNALLGLDAARLGWPTQDVSSSSSEEQEDEDEVEEEEEEEEEDDEEGKQDHEDDQEQEVSRSRLRRRAGRKPSATAGRMSPARQRASSPRLSRKSARSSAAGAGVGAATAKGSAGGEIPGAGAGVGAEDHAEGPKYGFRDRRTLKRTQFFTYDQEEEESDEASEEEEEHEEEDEEHEEEDEEHEEEEPEDDEEDVEEDEKSGQTSAKRKPRRYKLRKREVTRRQVFNVRAEERLPRRKTRKIIPYSIGPRRMTLPKRKGASASVGGGEGSRRRQRRRHSTRRTHFDSSSESSSDAGGDGFADHDHGFHRYQRKVHERELGSIRPINPFGPASGGGGSGGGGSNGGGQGSIVDKASARDLLRADVSPMDIDPNITFSSIGGGKRHVRMLKEMVMLPLVYPELFESFGAAPPKGVLFYGPPGTGKTLTARALANACTKSGHRISFFMRKGADCLSKWVGEAERQLRLLFEQARRYQPSIIFFDEIDGLAPVRSVKQDQIHASVVSTLLALMDGLDSRGQVIVIGATNRPDSLDPALRRPGRFDRELAFPLPTRRARREILRVHTKDWTPPLDPELEAEIAERTPGFCGADMKALCAEATLLAVRRRYPQIYASEEKLLLDAKSVKVTRSHFLGALRGLTPSSQREGINPACPLPPHLFTLLSESLKAMIDTLKVQFPQSSHGKDAGGEPEADSSGEDSWSSDDDTDSEAGEIVAPLNAGPQQGILSQRGVFGGGREGMARLGRSVDVGSGSSRGAVQGFLQGLGGKSGIGSTWVHRPRLVLYGCPGCGQRQLAAAALHALDGIPVHSLALHSLHGDPSRTAEAALVSRFVEARRNVPSVLYLPGAHHWWEGEDAAVHPHLRTLLINLLDEIPDTWPILVVSTWDVKPDEEPADLAGRGGDSIRLGALGKTSPIAAHGSASRRQLISALLGGSCGEVAALASVGGAASDSRSGAFGGGGEDAQPRPYSCIGAIEMRPSGDEERTRFAEEILSTLSATLTEAFCPRRPRGTARKAPPPLPLAPPPVRQEVEEEEVEDTSLLKQDQHYLRELRICLRHVLGKIRKDPKFSMFRQIGDYDGEYMDLDDMLEKVNGEKYLTLDEFEADLKLMNEEAKEVRDRLKAELRRAENHAAAITAGASRLTRSSRSTSDANALADASVAPAAAPVAAVAAVASGTPAVAGGSEAERQALRDVQRLETQLARAANAVYSACAMGDTALSALQDCVSRLGYDLEAICKEIAMRQRQRNARDGKLVGVLDNQAGGHVGGTSSGASAGPSGSSRASPNYTSEGVIEDMYSGVGVAGVPRERRTRASRRSATSDGRFLQLGDHGKLVEQGTEEEVLVEQPPRKRACRDVLPAAEETTSGRQERERQEDAAVGQEAASMEGCVRRDMDADVAENASGQEDMPVSQANATVPDATRPPLALAPNGHQSIGTSEKVHSAEPPSQQAAASISPLPSMTEPMDIDGGEASRGCFATPASASHQSPSAANGLHAVGVVLGESVTTTGTALSHEESRRNLASLGGPQQAGQVATCRDEGDREAVFDGSVATAASASASRGHEGGLRGLPGGAGHRVHEATGKGGDSDAKTTITSERSTISATNLHAALVNISSYEQSVRETRQMAVSSAGSIANGGQGSSGTRQEGTSHIDADAGHHTRTTGSASTMGRASSALPVQGNGNSVGGAATAAVAEEMGPAQIPASVSTRATDTAAVSAATRQAAKAERRLARQLCAAACTRLLRKGGSIAESTRGWSVEQLLALRGELLELGAALCGRGVTRAKVNSITTAVDSLLRYTGERLSWS